MASGNPNYGVSGGQANVSLPNYTSFGTERKATKGKSKSKPKPRPKKGK